MHTMYVPLVLLHHFHSLSLSLSLSLSNVDSIPYDGRVSEEVLPVHFGLTTLFTLFSSAGIAFSIACLVFNFYFRKQT